LVDDVIRPDVEAALMRIHAAAEFARDWRNRHIAHHDFALAFDETAVPLAPVTRKKIDAAIQEIGILLNVIEQHYRDATTAFHRLIAPGQADDLVQLLNDAFVEDESFRERLRTHRLTEADLHKKWNEKI
jgi:hypothetical protein